MVYADDMSSLMVEDTEVNLQHEIDVMMNRFEYNFSFDGQCIIDLFICSGRPNTELYAGVQKESSHANLLGVTVSQCYTFRRHAKIIAWMVMSKVKKLANFKIRKVVDVVWGWRLDWLMIIQKDMSSVLRLFMEC